MPETLFSDQTMLLTNSLLVSLLLFGLWFSDRSQRHNLYWAAGLFLLFVVVATFPESPGNAFSIEFALCVMAGALAMPMLLQGTALYADRAVSTRVLYVVVLIGLAVFALLRALELRGAVVFIVGTVGVFWYMAWVLRAQGVVERLAALLFFARGIGLIVVTVSTGFAATDLVTDYNLLAVNQMLAMASASALLLVAVLANQRELELGRQLLRQSNVIAQRLGQLTNTEAVVRESIDILCKAAPGSTVWIYRVDDDQQILSLLDSGGRLSYLSDKNPVIPVADSVSGTAVKSGRVQLINHLAGDSRVNPRAKNLARQYGADLSGTNIVIPLLSGDRVYGTCSYHLAVERKVKEAELEAYAAIGQTIGLALANVDNLEKMTFRANHDSLTGLPNRSALHETFAAHIAVHADLGATMFLLDLDKFKDVNDTLGHHVGDQLIREIGPRLCRVDAPGDLIAARLGGDEFVLLLLRSLELKEALALGAAILEAVRARFNVDDLSLSVDGSIGVAIYPTDGVDSHELLRSADVAMYQAKSTTAPVVAYSQSFDPHSRERLVLMSELKSAIGGEQLVLHYQPKISLSTHRVTGVEALLRWEHPEHGMVPPGTFIPMAEVSPMINDISLWVLQRALEDVSAWDSENLSVAINVSMRNLADDTWYKKAIALIEASPVDATRLELELTESVFMHAPDEVSRKLNALADTGVRIAIDDFGTGFSSLSYLRRLPIKQLKIDQSFVVNLDQSLADQQIVDSILSLASAMDLEVVAEGIESEQVLVRLQEAGCHYAQGYYIARPMPLDALANWVESRKDGFHAACEA